ncbi:flagellar brake protein [Lachnospira multipara]|uniref:flagellar brake protein n=1 Tax=Lachnospira multipara TaxID=28051 RepID=UPI0004804573|nr:flagellar brake protein [Lachnospira multipara]
MLSRIAIGTKMEIARPFDRFTGELTTNKSYISQVLDIRSDELVCAMPIFEGRIVPLEVESDYVAYFYTSQGIYKADVIAVSRSKEGNIYTVNFKLQSDLIKFQRREFYRLECTIEVRLISLTDEETKFFLKESKLPNNLQETFLKAIIVDISGGGVRVFTPRQLNITEFVSLEFELKVLGKIKRFRLAGKVVMSSESPNISDIYDTRIEFKRIAENDRADIVKYIFEQQRRLRKMERG